MILLDTNVIGELPSVESAIRPWFVKQDPSQFRISVTSLTEINFGFQRLPTGRKRSQLLADWVEFADWLTPRTLPITVTIANMAGAVLAQRELLGRRIDLADAQIAATALVHRAALATRNTKDFDDLGIELVNPWEWRP